MSVSLSISSSKRGTMKQQRQFGRYLKCLTLTSICSLLLVSGFNWFVDPYGIFNSPHLEGFNALKPEFNSHLRMAKAYAVRQSKPSAIILGTSRAEFGINPNHSRWSFNQVYNSALSSANIYEITRYFQHANAVRPLKQVVLTLDFFSFNIYSNNQEDFDENRLSVSFDGKKNMSIDMNDIIISTGSLDAFLSSIQTITHQKDENSNYLENGMRIYPSMPNTHAAFLGSEEGYMNTKEYLPERFKFTNMETGISSFDYYRKILQIAYQDNIDLRIAISPSHAREWEALAAVGLWPKFEEWKSTLVEITEEEAFHAGKTPLPIWDFSIYNEFTTEAVPPLGDTTTKMRWWREPSHYKREFGDLMLDRIFNYPAEAGISYGDFGVLLTSKNIDEHLRNIRVDRELYRETHHDDVAEIEALAQKWRVLLK